MLPSTIALSAPVHVGGSSKAVRAIAEDIRSPVRAGRVLVTDDALTSYLGALGFEPGTPLAALKGRMRGAMRAVVVEGGGRSRGEPVHRESDH